MCEVTEKKECGRAILGIEKKVNHLIENMSETKTELAVFKEGFSGLKASLDRLVEKHETEAVEENIALKKELREKETLAETKKWQIKIMAIAAILSFISSLAMFYISLK